MIALLAISIAHFLYVAQSWETIPNRTVTDDLGGAFLQLVASDDLKANTCQRTLLLT